MLVIQRKSLGFRFLISKGNNLFDQANRLKELRLELGLSLGLGLGLGCRIGALLYASRSRATKQQRALLLIVPGFKLEVGTLCVGGVRIVASGFEGSMRRRHQAFDGIKTSIRHARSTVEIPKSLIRTASHMGVCEMLVLILYIVVRDSLLRLHLYRVALVNWLGLGLGWHRLLTVVVRIVDVEVGSSRFELHRTLEHDYVFGSISEALFSELCLQLV